MLNEKTLHKIITLSLKRRGTAIKRLHTAQLRGDDVMCDRMYLVIQYENQLIDNAQADLTHLEGVDQLWEELFGEAA